MSSRCLDSDNCMRPSPAPIVIAGERFGFPYGSGASARIIAYSKAIIYAHSQVTVLCMNFTEIDIKTAVNLRRSGVFEQIPFEYVSGSPIRNTNFLKRRLGSALGKIRTVHRIIVKKPVAIIGYTKSLPNMIFLALASRLVGSKLVLEMCEITYKEPASSKFESFRRRCRYGIVSYLSDGFIAISDFMVGHITDHYTDKKPILKIPILVDSSDFCLENVEIDNFITYLGNLNHTDEIMELLKSFSLVSQDYENIQLQIAGTTSDKRKIENIVESINKAGISNKVHLTGIVRREDLPSLLCSSMMLLLPRKRGLFSDAGFPTKLGEYLASGRPVVVTDVGEISHYLTNMKNALVVEPGNPEDFATAVKYLLENPKIANEIGTSGRNTAEREFDYRKHGASLVNYLVSL